MMGDLNNDSHWLCLDNNTHWLGLSICTGYYYYVFYLRYMVIMSSKHLNAQYNLRWPDELKEKIAQSAKEHNRSMNADIVARLEDSFTKHTPDFAITSIIPAYLTGLISKYETQKIVNLSVLSKIEATSDEPSIKFLKKEIERCEILLSEMQVLLKHFKSVYKLEDENKAP